MENITDFIIGTKVRWYYKGSIDKEVIIASDVVGLRVRIDHLTKNGSTREGGYVNIDELYKISL